MPIERLTIFKCKCGCGQFVPEGREDKEYIDRTHKARAQKKRQRLGRYAGNATKAVNGIEGFLGDERMRNRALEKLWALKSSVDALIETHDPVGAGK